MHQAQPGNQRVAWKRQRVCWSRPALVSVCLIALASGTLRCRSAGSQSAPPPTLQIGVALPRFGGTGIGVNGFFSLLTQEPLIGIGWDGRPTPRLVAEWRIDPDGRRVRLRLDSRVKFHDNS